MGLATIFLTLFLVFSRPDIGAILVSILLLPIVVIAWVDFLLLRRNAAAYLRERDAFLKSQNGAPRS